jgi:hypothetical protein
MGGLFSSQLEDSNNVTDVMHILEGNKNNDLETLNIKEICQNIKDGDLFNASKLLNETRNLPTDVNSDNIVNILKEKVETGQSGGAFRKRNRHLLHDIFSIIEKAEKEHGITESDNYMQGGGKDLMSISSDGNALNEIRDLVNAELHKQKEDGQKGGGCGCEKQEGGGINLMSSSSSSSDSSFISNSNSSSSSSTDGNVPLNSDVSSNIVIETDDNEDGLSIFPFNSSDFKSSMSDGKNFNLMRRKI